MSCTDGYQARTYVYHFGDDSKNPVNVVLQPVISDELLEGDDKHRVVKFDRTPVMSTYLLALIVGEYDYVEAADSDGVLVRVYTPVGKKEQGQFALNVMSSYCH